MVKLRPLKEYSIWLEPEKKDLFRIRKIFQSEQKQTKSPFFIPHVTLVGGLTGLEKEIISKIKGIKKIKNIEITFKKISYNNKVFKTVFIECNKSKELMSLNKEIQNIFNIKKAYNPHMSVIYGTFNQRAKKDSAQRLKTYPLETFSFTVRKVSLWKAFGTVNKWKRIKL